MNASNDPVLDRIENADRMLRQARTEHQRGNPEDAAEFLAAARRNIDRASEAMKTAALTVKTTVDGVAIAERYFSPREKGRIESAHQKEVARAR